MNSICRGFVVDKAVNQIYSKYMANPPANPPLYDKSSMSLQQAYNIETCQNARELPWIC